MVRFLVGDEQHLLDLGVPICILTFLPYWRAAVANKYSAALFGMTALLSL